MGRGIEASSALWSNLRAKWKTNDKESDNPFKIHLKFVPMKLLSILDKPSLPNIQKESDKKLRTCFRWETVKRV